MRWRLYDNLFQNKDVLQFTTVFFFILFSNVFFEADIENRLEEIVLQQLENICFS